MPRMQAQLRQINDYIVRAASLQFEEVAAGPFRAFLHPTSDNPWFSYVVPVDSWADDVIVERSVVMLRALFRSRGRKLRFELLEARWPSLPNLLQNAGLHVEERHPLMVCTPDMLAARQAPGVAVRFITEVDDLDAYQSLKSHAFGGIPRPASPERVAQARADLRNGLRYALATLDGEAAGVGGYYPAGAICEVIGVATLPSMRRRGVAATVTSFLTRAHFDDGGDLAWLTAGDSRAESVYHQLGYRTVTAALHYGE